MSEPRRVLVVCTRRIGDVLLATPLARSLKRHWPAARIDMLVFAGTDGVLAGNPDLAQVIALPAHTPWRARLGELRRIWRGYDLALATIASDRARLYARAAARRALGTIDVTHEAHSKRWLLDRWVPFDDLDTHTVVMALRLADLAGAPRAYEVVAPSAGGALPEAARGADYAVLHPYPKFNYKMWHVPGWVALARALAARGLRVLLTGSGEADERRHAEDVAAASGALSLAGTLSLAQSADLLRGARLYVGPDTVMTHIAAAVGAPTVALFGPSNPVKWGPWPAGWAQDASPWARVGSARQRNVLLLQGQADCVPCLMEGCERHVASFSECLQTLPAARVIEAAQAMLVPA